MLFDSDLSVNTFCVILQEFPFLLCTVVLQAVNALLFFVFILVSDYCSHQLYPRMASTRSAMMQQSQVSCRTDIEHATNSKWSAVAPSFWSSDSGAA